MLRRFLIVNAIALIFVGFAAHALAQEYTTDEKRHFTERPYKTAEPGMLTPAAYIELAKKAVKKMSNEIVFREFQDGVVFRRFYRDAPPEDRDIVGVAFVYAGDISGGGLIGGGFVYMKDAKRPVIMVLMRKNLSKIYVNLAHLKERQ
ncbi:MAG: hypothetical protein ACJ8NS_14770 [Chthoniobacterales bacterium]|jgi:hypothetical protein